MDLDELERRTHEQIRELQEEYRKRVEPLNKILHDIEMVRPMRPITVSKEQWDRLHKPDPEPLATPAR